MKTGPGYKKKQQQHGNYTLEILANIIPLATADDEGKVTVIGNASKTVFPSNLVQAIFLFFSQQVILLEKA